MDTQEPAGKPKFHKTSMLFLAAGMYQFAVAVFFLISEPLGEAFSLVQLAVALLFVFGVLCCNIALNPVRYKKLVPYAILPNLVYCALAGWYYANGQLPLRWMVPGIIDAVFLILLAAAWMRLFWEDDDI